MDHVPFEKVVLKTIIVIYKQLLFVNSKSRYILLLQIVWNLPFNAVQVQSIMRVTPRFCMIR